MLKSIYVLDKNSNYVRNMMTDMKKIMVKGVGYFVVGKSIKLTPSLLRSIAQSMEEQGIKEL